VFPVAFIMTRLQVGDYDVFKPMFDQDKPGVRTTASGYRLYRSVEDPNEVFIQVEFDSAEEAGEGRAKLLASGVLERWADRTGPTVVEETETVAY
jgi:hypothetical protein